MSGGGLWLYEEYLCCRSPVLEGSVSVKKMTAVLLNGTGGPEALQLSQIDVPTVKPGWVLIKIRAFGLNRAELALRQYEADAPYIHLPIIPGIECVGEIVDPSDSQFAVNDRVVALMGGMGRSFDGSYAEYALLPVTHVFLVKTNLAWTKLAAIPETFFTAHGSLFECLQLGANDSLLVHGATSALGLAAIQLAKTTGCTVIGTSRKKERLGFLKEVGADIEVLDDKILTKRIREVFPDGVTKVLELVGARAIPETAKLLKKHGIICSTGQLGGNTTSDFDVIKSIPNGVYLSSFYSNYPTQAVIDDIFKRIEEHHLDPIIGAVFSLADISLAHEMMENNQAQGKIVIITALDPVD